MLSLSRDSLGDLQLWETGVVREAERWRTEEYLSTALHKWGEHADILKQKNLNFLKNKYKEI